MFSSDWSISRKLTLAFALVIAAFVIVAISVFFELDNISKTSLARDRSEAQISRVNEVSKSMLEIGGQVRGYLLTRDNFFTKGIDNNYSHILNVLNDLQANADSDDQRASFTAMSVAIHGFKDEIVDPQIQIASSPATADQAVALMKASAKKKWLAAFRSAEKAFDDREQAIQVARTAASNRAIGGARLGIIAGAGAALAIAAGLGWMLNRQISAPVVAMTAAMKRLAAGDNAVVVPAVGRGDEVGEMAAAVQTFQQAAIERIRLAAEAAAMRESAERERQRNEASNQAAAQDLAHVVKALSSAMACLSARDLTCRVNETLAAQYQKLQLDFNAAVEKLQETMAVIAENSSEITIGAEEISKAADNLANRTEQQAASLEQTAAALDQITATVRRSAEGAATARSVVAKAKNDAEQSGEVVREAIAAMSQIESSSLQISQIIGVIDEIAFQTNLLALNAGVEAARAGDAGRGFAVVASEVRSLAQRAAEAAKEIKALISDSGRQVGAGVSLVTRTGEALEGIIIQVAQIDAVVREIAASAQEEATSLNEVNIAMNQMDHVTQQNAAMVEQVTAASHRLSSEAEVLGDLIGQFNTGSNGRTGASGSSTPHPRALRRA